MAIDVVENIAQTQPLRRIGCARHSKVKGGYESLIIRHSSVDSSERCGKPRAKVSNGDVDARAPGRPPAVSLSHHVATRPVLSGVLRKFHGHRHGFGEKSFNDPSTDERVVQLVRRPIDIKRRLQRLNREARVNLVLLISINFPVQSPSLVAELLIEPDAVEVGSSDPVIWKSDADE